MINTSYKFFVDNSDIKIQKRVLFVTAGTALMLFTHHVIKNKAR